MFHAYQDKGFQIAFANGLTASVMFGRRNYCEHRHAEKDSPDGSEDAELAVFYTAEERGGYVFADGINGTGHCGWLTPEMIAKAIASVAAYDPATQACADLVEQLKKDTT